MLPPGLPTVYTTVKGLGNKEGEAVSGHHKLQTHSPTHNRAPLQALYLSSNERRNYHLPEGPTASTYQKIIENLLRKGTARREKAEEGYCVKTSRSPIQRLSPS